MDLTTLPEKIQTHLTSRLQTEDTQAQVSVQRTSLGWLRIMIVTSCFEGLPSDEREQKIDNILAGIDFHLSKYPISGYELLTPEEQPPKYIQLRLPLWSDILMAPEPDQPVELDEDTPKRPLIVTFYSFKGGVGRSTALGLVAGILATRNRRVAIVDFDLEAPGLSILLQPDVEILNEEQYGVLDYLHQRFLTPEENDPTIESCICKINLRTRGELFLVPVGEYDENYIHRLADLDRGTWQAFYRGEKNPVEQLMADIKAQLNPDVILIDARPGFNDTSAIALFDLADTGIICFSPTDQSFAGLRWVVQGVRKQRDYQGKPDLRFLVTPMPPVTADQHQTWIVQVEDWIEESWGVPSGTTVGELHYEVPYNPNITTLSSLVNDVPKSLLNDYLQIADAIDASLPDIKTSAPTTILETRKILHELRFEAATAQQLAAEKIPKIFQRTDDFPEFLSNNNWLIRGAKGTGKSLLFRLFVEQAEQAKELAKYYVDLKNFDFIAGHGQPRLSGPVIEGSDLASYEKQVGDNSWKYFWLNYALLQLCHAQPELRSLPILDKELVKLSIPDSPSHTPIVSWLVQRTQSPQALSQAGDELRAIDRWLQERDRHVWLLYDELDAGFGSTKIDYDRRKNALEALLEWWLESGTSLKYIVPKIFLREDIWNQLNFTNKGHYSGRSLQLRWEEADLWRLVLRQALNSSESLSQTLNQELGVTVERLDKSGLDQLRKSLYYLWGERMGRGNAAYTYNWVRKRTADSQKNRFPRSLILLLEEAIKIEKDYSTDYYERILRPRALIDAFPEVSKQRVAEVRNEYPELVELLDKLQEQRSPIDENQLERIWNMEDSNLSLQIRSMIDAGIFKERSRPKDPPPRVYNVAELYLYGLNMVRLGPR
ncbi:MAG: AAA family ATPase [Hormoscilla sp. GM7CHS1pb]|nr:AAA family ATPase [Hormoscilla sp. GM7CHS1pb]